MQFLLKYIKYLIPLHTYFIASPIQARLARSVISCHGSISHSCKEAFLRKHSYPPNKHKMLLSQGVSTCWYPVLVHSRMCSCLLMCFVFVLVLLLLLYWEREREREREVLMGNLYIIFYIFTHLVGNIRHSNFGTKHDAIL